jgi:hypothetical protein
MSSILYRINSVLSRVVAAVPIGTNLGLFHLLWMLLSGRLLQSRGAVIPGLADLGLAADAVWRCWAALAYGKWQAQQLLRAWEQFVREGASFQAHQYGRYRPVACDLVGFFRPRLQDCLTKHYSSTVGKALPAISVGIAARIGTVGTQRLAVPCLLVRSETTDTRETALQTRLLQRLNEQLAEDEALVCDRRFPLRQLQAAGMQRYVARGLSTLGHGEQSSRPTKGRDVNPPTVPSSTPSHARTRSAPLLQRRPTAKRPGSSTLGCRKF